MSNRVAKFCIETGSDSLSVSALNISFFMLKSVAIVAAERVSQFATSRKCLSSKPADISALVLSNPVKWAKVTVGKKLISSFERNVMQCNLRELLIIVEFFNSPVFDYAR
ncbi:MAG: hypothetical protein ACPH9N_03920 [Alteromonas sp.]